MSKRIPNPVQLPGAKSRTRDPMDFRPIPESAAPKGESAPAPAESEQKPHPATATTPRKSAPKKPAGGKRAPGNVLN